MRWRCPFPPTILLSLTQFIFVMGQSFFMCVWKGKMGNIAGRSFRWYLGFDGWRRADRQRWGDALWVCIRSQVVQDTFSVSPAVGLSGFVFLRMEKSSLTGAAIDRPTNQQPTAQRQYTFWSASVFSLGLCILGSLSEWRVSVLYIDT
ncbi:hypothetical protein B0H66DRAFT_550822 [Apodospora peruviana]|uniref:Uncharacterized protein n=1 Tax=Apodospora peruviana TaxID=516989 RepID=A0AAE0MBJ5_9PEZI|nr:hypothetical protein B0H66DRAFT_550822 [Apodospora peruviana]